MGKRKIQTVNGPVDAEELGIVMSHEHFFWGWLGWLGDSTCAETYEEVIEAVRSEVESVKAWGVKTIIDATTNEAGRDPVLLKRISDEFNIHIICPTGYYNQEYGAAMYFKRRRAFGCDVDAELQEMYRRELYEGIGKTGIRAGYLKLAVSEEMTRYEEMFFKAACKVASADKEVRVFIHHMTDRGIEQTSDYLLEHGVDPRQVYLGHACSSGNIERQIRLAEQGFYLGYDQFGMKTAIHTDNKIRLDQLMELLNAGCEDQLMISTDRTRHDLGRANTYTNERYNSLFITDRWDYLFTYVLPELEKRGMTPKQREKLTGKNAARYLGDSFQ